VPQPEDLDRVLRLNERMQRPYEGRDGGGIGGDNDITTTNGERILGRP
jgi:hypothetical protein